MAEDTAAIDTLTQKERKKESSRLGCLFFRAHWIQIIDWMELPAWRERFLLSVNTVFENALANTPRGMC